MKTHDVAKALNTLARALREGENAPLEKVTVQTELKPTLKTSLGANAPAALALLVRLSSYSKDEWRELLKELELDVPIKTTDSVRDILGRLLKYLNDHKDIQTRLVERARKPQVGTSPELMKALSILMNKDDARGD